MALQQLGGVNGILFYASEVFVSAGNDMNNDSLFCYLSPKKKRVLLSQKKCLTGVILGHCTNIHD